MNEQGVRWDDLRILLAIAENGSLSGAGRTLNMSHATVFRRLKDMEQRLGVTLFERHRDGYQATAAGTDLAGSASRIREEVLGAERRLAGQDLKLSGTIRVTTTDSLFAGALAPVLSDFRADYPAIELELVLSNQLHSLTRRDADIAIRPTNRPPETLVGRCVGSIRQAVYGSRTRWQGTTVPVPTATLDNEDWIGPDARMGDTALEAWISPLRVPYRLDSILAMRQAAVLGGGITVLPCYLGNSEPELIQLTEPLAALDIQLWLLTHPDLRKVARIRAFLQIIGERLREALQNGDQRRNAGDSDQRHHQEETP